MIKNPFPILLAAAFVCAPAFTDGADEKPLTEGELLKQIGTLKPNELPPAAKSTAKPAAKPAGKPAPEPLSKAIAANGEIAKVTPENGAAYIGQPHEKKAKGSTEIDALEAVFDQKANTAVFVGSVVVTDPEFNVTCDKLTAYLKHEDKDAQAKSPQKPATPNPDASAPAKKSGGLERAIAISTSERRVIIRQDKTDANGKTTHGLGRADRAEYNAITGDIVLTGNPDVTQDMNRCIATSPDTVMTLNRDGHMTAKGPVRTIIVSDDGRDANKGNAQ